ncbi:hypothetical protein ACFPRL_14120 [Pseudoclavibacter helvolus]
MGLASSRSSTPTLSSGWSSTERRGKRESSVMPSDGQPGMPTQPGKPTSEPTPIAMRTLPRPGPAIPRGSWADPNSPSRVRSTRCEPMCWATASSGRRQRS